MSFKTEHETDAELEWNEQRVHEALMVLCGYFGTDLDTLRKVGGFEDVLAELESLARHGWNGGKRYAHTAPTIPAQTSSGTRHVAVEVQAKKRRL